MVALNNQINELSDNRYQLTPITLSATTLLLLPVVAARGCPTKAENDKLGKMVLPGKGYGQICEDGSRQYSSCTCHRTCSGLVPSPKTCAEVIEQMQKK
jgi:hypothetical protein